jgi:hypothetical protein
VGYVKVIRCHLYCLFLFWNDLVAKIKATGKVASIDNEEVSILFYADDIINTTENENNLLYLLDV